MPSRYYKVENSQSDVLDRVFLILWINAFNSCELENVFVCWTPVGGWLEFCSILITPWLKYKQMRATTLVPPQATTNTLAGLTYRLATR